jgi:hypothetical protein
MDISYLGLTRSHKEWAAFCGVSEQTMRWRIAHWPLARALTTRKVDGDAPRVVKVRKRDIKPEQMAILHQLYFDKHSEDAIAKLTGVPRRMLSEILKETGVKMGGAKPRRITEAARVAAASVIAHANGLSITIETVA